MSDESVCEDCGAVLSQGENESFGEPEYCPHCGAKQPVAYFSATATASLTVASPMSGYAIIGFEVGPAAQIFSAHNLLLQTVVTLGAKTTEGQLIEMVALPWFEIIKALENDPQLRFDISPRKLEEIIAGAYQKAGYEEVILTPQSGDFGRDVIAIKKGIGSVRVIDQVKAYKPGHLVTANDVRALVGVLSWDGASKGFLTTTSDFAPRLYKDPVVTTHVPSRLELINGEKLLLRLAELAKK
jgi:restriction system protein